MDIIFSCDAALNVNYLGMFNAQVWVCINFEGIGLRWQNGRAKLV